MNSNVVLYIDGPEKTGKTTITQELYNRCLSNNISVNVFTPNFVYKEDVLYQSGYPVNVLNLLNYLKQAESFRKNKTLVTLCDTSFLDILVKVYLKPTMEVIKDEELFRFFEYLGLLLPDSLIPTHIFLFSNTSYTQDKEVQKQHGHVIEAFNHILKLNYIKNALQQHKTTICRIHNNKISDTLDIIKTVVEERYDPRFAK